MSKLYVDEIQPKTTDGVINAKGMVIQVQSTTDTSDQGTTQTSYQNTNTTVVITPKSTSSKILLMCSFVSQVSGSRGRWTIHSSATGGAIHPSGELGFQALEATNVNIPASFHYVDSPNTTSSITYTLQFLNEGGNNTYITASTPCVLTAMEIGG